MDPEKPPSPHAGAPVDLAAHGPRDDEPQPGIALCLSGGGYRAMLFHAGSIWRLYEAGLLRKLDRISSVSGGSIAAGMLALRWSSLSFHPAAVREDLVPQVVDPIRRLAGKTIDIWSVILGLILPGSVSDRVAGAYRRNLFGRATLADLPDRPRFVINATNVQSGALWRFMKPYMRDWRVGEVKNPTIGLAAAVAASSAFPPILSPARMRLRESDFTPGSGADLQRAPFTTEVFLTDGGVYDNLGLETAWKRCQTILVSDAGGQMAPEPRPWCLWPLHAFRALELIDNQVRNLRKRQLIDSFVKKARAGAYWGIRSNVGDYHLTDPLPCPFERTMELAATPTRLAKVDPERQERLINWGYAACDAALRRHVDPALPRPTDFPYPGSGI